jgi:hypothetical protein
VNQPFNQSDVRMLRIVLIIQNATPKQSFIDINRPVKTISDVGGVGVVLVRLSLIAVLRSSR